MFPQFIQDLAFTSSRHDHVQIVAVRRAVPDESKRFRGKNIEFVRARPIEWNDGVQVTGLPAEDENVQAITGSGVGIPPGPEPLPGQEYCIRLALRKQSIPVMLQLQKLIACLYQPKLHTFNWSI